MGNNTSTPLPPLNPELIFANTESRLIINKHITSTEIGQLAGQIGHPGCKCIDLFLHSTKILRKDYIIFIQRGLLLNTSINMMDLSNTGLDDSGAHQIARLFLYNNTLETVIINDNLITNIGLTQILKSLERNTSLHTLSIIGNPITDEKLFLQAKSIDQRPALQFQHKDIDHTISINSSPTIGTTSSLYTNRNNQNNNIKNNDQNQTKDSLKNPQFTQTSSTGGTGTSSTTTMHTLNNPIQQHQSQIIVVTATPTLSVLNLPDAPRERRRSRAGSKSNLEDLQNFQNSLRNSPLGGVGGGNSGSDGIISPSVGQLGENTSSTIASSRAMNTGGNGVNLINTRSIPRTASQRDIFMGEEDDAVALNYLENSSSTNSLGDIMKEVNNNKNKNQDITNTNSKRANPSTIPSSRTEQQQQQQQQQPTPTLTTGSQQKPTQSQQQQQQQQSPTVDPKNGKNIEKNDKNDKNYRTSPSYSGSSTPNIRIDNGSDFTTDDDDDDEEWEINDADYRRSTTFLGNGIFMNTFTTQSGQNTTNRSVNSGKNLDVTHIKANGTNNHDENEWDDVADQDLLYISGARSAVRGVKRRPRGGNTTNNKGNQSMRAIAEENNGNNDDGDDYDNDDDDEDYYSDDDYFQNETVLQSGYNVHQYKHCSGGTGPNSGGQNDQNSGSNNENNSGSGGGLNLLDYLTMDFDYFGAAQVSTNVEDIVRKGSGRSQSPLLSQQNNITTTTTTVKGKKKTKIIQQEPEEEEVMVTSAKNTEKSTEKRSKKDKNTEKSDKNDRPQPSHVTPQVEEELEQKSTKTSKKKKQQQQQAQQQKESQSQSKQDTQTVTPPPPTTPTTAAPPTTTPPTTTSTYAAFEQPTQDNNGTLTWLIQTFFHENNSEENSLHNFGRMCKLYRRSSISLERYGQVLFYYFNFSQLSRIIPRLISSLYEHEYPDTVQEWFGSYLQAPAMYSLSTYHADLTDKEMFQLSLCCCKVPNTVSPLDGEDYEIYLEEKVRKEMNDDNDQKNGKKLNFQTKEEEEKKYKNGHETTTTTNILNQSQWNHGLSYELYKWWVNEGCKYCDLPPIEPISIQEEERIQSEVRNLYSGLSGLLPGTTSNFGQVLSPHQYNQQQAQHQQQAQQAQQQQQQQQQQPQIILPNINNTPKPIPDVNNPPKPIKKPITAANPLFPKYSDDNNDNNDNNDKIDNVFKDETSFDSVQVRPLHKPTIETTQPSSRNPNLLHHRSSIANNTLNNLNTSTADILIPTLAQSHSAYQPTPLSIHITGGGGDDDDTHYNQDGTINIKGTNLQQPSSLRQSLLSSRASLKTLDRSDLTRLLNSHQNEFLSASSAGAAAGIPSTPANSNYTNKNNIKNDIEPTPGSQPRGGAVRNSPFLQMNDKINTTAPTSPLTTPNKTTSQKPIQIPNTCTTPQSKQPQTINLEQTPQTPQQQQQQQHQRHIKSYQFQLDTLDDGTKAHSASDILLSPRSSMANKSSNSGNNHSGSNMDAIRARLAFSRQKSLTTQLQSHSLLPIQEWLVLARQPNHLSPKSNESLTLDKLDEVLNTVTTDSSQLRKEPRLSTLLFHLHLVFPNPTTPSGRYQSIDHLSQTPTYEEIKRVYHQIALIVHPDRLVDKHPSIKSRGTEIFAHISQAFKRYSARQTSNSKKMNGGSGGDDDEKNSTDTVPTAKRSDLDAMD